MTGGSIRIPKVWRSEAGALIVFVVLCLGSVVLSKRFPSLVVTGELVSIGGKTLWLTLPILWCLPVGWLSMIVFRIYNVRYIADTRGIEACEGVLSLSQRITRVRYEDVRSIESDQTLLERLLDVGTVEIGTAAVSGVELAMKGIAAPKAVQEFIQNERERRHQMFEGDIRKVQPVTVQNS
jgi:uncharacterized membrane protein YdbT with pleckstrin-like domain